MNERKKSNERRSRWLKKSNRNNIFFISDKKQITASFAKSNFERKNSKEELVLYLLRSYIRFYCTASGKVCSTLNAITEGCGSPTKGNSRESNDKFREALIWLQEQGFIICDKDIHTIKNSEYFEIQILNHNLFYCGDTSFVSISMHEFETIVNSQTTTKKNILLATYLCIKKNIYNNVDMYLPSLSVPSNEIIKRVLGVSSVTTVGTAIANLKELGLLYCDETMYYYKDLKTNVYKPTRNAYALTSSDLQYTKEVLKDFYQVDKIYTINEIDNDKIFYPKRK